jgi:hypothetical protein
MLEEIKWLEKVSKLVDVENTDDSYNKGKKAIRQFAYGDELMTALGGINAVIDKLKKLNS